MPDTEFSRSVVIGQVIDRHDRMVRRAGLVLGLISVLALFAAILLGRPVWLSNAAYAFMGSWATLLVSHFVLGYLKGRECGHD